MFADIFEKKKWKKFRISHGSPEIRRCSWKIVQKSKSALSTSSGGTLWRTSMAMLKTLRSISENLCRSQSSGECPIKYLKDFLNSQFKKKTFENQWKFFSKILCKNFFEKKNPERILWGTHTEILGNRPKKLFWNCFEIILKLF